MPLTLTRGAMSAQGFGQFIKRIAGAKYSGQFASASNQTLSLSTIVNCTGDFTVEAWVKPNTGSVAANPVIGGHYNSGTGNNSQFRINGGKLYAYLNGAALSGVTTIVDGAWVHLAASRQSGTLRLFVGGALDASTTTAAAFYCDCIAALNPASGFNPFDGLIHDFRLNNTTAIYTAPFTPPSANLTAVSGTQMLTCQSSTFINTSSSGITLTPNNSPTIVTQAPF